MKAKIIAVIIAVVCVVGGVIVSNAILNIIS